MFICAALAASAVVQPPGLYLTVQLHGVDSSDAKLSEFGSLLAEQASLAPASVTQVTASNVAPTAAALAPDACNRVSVTGLGAADHQAALMGYYMRRDALEAGHAAWESAEGKFIYFREASDGKSMWVVGPTLGSDQAGMLIESQASVPQAAAGQWYELADDGKWKAAAALIECDPVPTTELTTRVAPAGCAGADVAALKASMSDISDVLHRNGFVLSLRAAGLKADDLVYQRHSFRDCAPTISLSAPWAGKETQPLAVSKCHFDGHKIVIDHAPPDRSKPRHDSFACSHKHDKIADEWKCECRTWKGDGKPATGV